MKEILLILVLQLVYVPLLTLRTIFLVKNITSLAAIIGIAEMFIYVFGLSLVFSGDQSTLAMVVYAVGFGLGMFLGTRIEQKLAIGFMISYEPKSFKGGFLVERMKKKAQNR